MIYFIFFILIIFGFVYFVSLKKREASEIIFPFRKQNYLLSIAEKNFYDVLRPIADQLNAVVFIKVRLEDLLWTPPKYRYMRGYIRSRHIDFVLCGKEKVNPICAIELNDSSHNRVDRIQRDDRITKILASAKLPFLQVIARASYDPEMLLRDIKKTLNWG